MRSPHDSDPLKSNTGTQYLRARERGRDTGSDAATAGLTLEGERRPQRSECASCMYYDPERAYCSYIHAPVDILFVCPQILDKRR
ncbi:hypothetical protein [Methanoculleus sp.]|jgi:hypothetical protein|uniref:hypothetical protein n=1 Tax=Methanoculleus sp. TaxID=90427 RepID=UPI001BD3B549|nr:hypothetical protein [Methanoculleus sp.]